MTSSTVWIDSLRMWASGPDPFDRYRVKRIRFDSHFLDTYIPEDRAWHVYERSGDKVFVDGKAVKTKGISFYPRPLPSPLSVRLHLYRSDLRPSSLISAPVPIDQLGD